MSEVLLATDADWIHDEVDAALSDSDTKVVRLTAGREVLAAVKDGDPDLVILDLQIGNMGGMATCMSLRLEEGAGRLDRRPVLMLLDRPQDVFLARRSDADGWLVKPLDARRLQAAASALLAGDTWTEGVTDEDDGVVEPMIRPGEGDDADPTEVDPESTETDAEPVAATTD
jgi:DNA-binding response OmpR family regulator